MNNQDQVARFNRTPRTQRLHRAATRWALRHMCDETVDDVSLKQICDYQTAAAAVDHAKAAQQTTSREQPTVRVIKVIYSGLRDDTAQQPPGQQQSLLKALGKQEQKLIKIAIDNIESTATTKKAGVQQYLADHERVGRIPKLRSFLRDVDRIYHQRQFELIRLGIGDAAALKAAQEELAQYCSAALKEGLEKTYGEPDQHDQRRPTSKLVWAGVLLFLLALVYYYVIRS